MKDNSINKLKAILLAFIISLIPISILTLKMVVKSPEFRIWIHSDEDFKSYGFPGNGTVENPFRIENFVITTSEETAIYITNVTKHFLIQNNVLKSARKAIWIYYVSANTCRIERNICYGSGGGIIVYYAQGSCIFNNTCYHNSYEGILIWDSNHSIIANNLCYKNGGPIIVVYESSSVIVENNTLEFDNNIYSSRVGIAMYDSLFTSIQYNYLDNCGCSFYFDNYSNYNTLILMNNELNGKKFEFGYYFDTHNFSINICEFDQIHLVNCTNVKISNSSFSLTNFGIKLTQCFNVNIENCSFSSIGIEGGIHMVDLENVTISNNTFRDSYYGVDSYVCNDIEISNNTIEKNLDGLRLNYSNVTLNYNLFIDNYHGCYMFSCGYDPSTKINDKLVNYNCTLSFNLFINNEIAIEVFTSICLVSNNSFEYNNLSMHILGWDAIAYIIRSNCSIINNEFTYNHIGCKMELANAILDNNYFAYNDIGLHILDSSYQLISNLFENNGDDIFIES